MQQPHHHRSLQCSIYLVYQVVLLVLSTLQLGKGDLLPSKVLKTLGFVASLQKLAKESGNLEQELGSTFCANITRSDQVLIITCLRYSCM